MRVTAVVGHKSQEPEEGTWVVVAGDESSLSLTANQQIFRRHLVNRLAHRSLAHIEARRQFAFAGYCITRTPLAGLQTADHELLDLPV